ncbi:cache domain-containing sensor histidine kinase [Cohnella sp. 56]|uniref:cache domain-containing sensor histidine kinase n=1 Tax=Cohnella sp. 56 TaxID=3113722 RepID=UPI0030EAB1B9
MRGLLRAFRDLSLRKKLILSYCAVIIIPLCLLGAYAYSSSNQDLKRQLRVSAATTADQLSSELAYRFERQAYPIKSIVFNPQVISAVADTDKDVYELAVDLNEDVEPIFWNYLFFMSEMKEIAIYSERRDKAFGNFFQPASLVRSEAWYAATGTSTATRWWSDGRTLFATRNIYEPGNGERQGMLYIRFDFERMVSEVMNKINRADGVVLKDSGGEVVYSSLKEGEAAAPDAFLRMDRAIPQTGWTLSYYAGTEHIAEGTAGIIEATAVMIVLCMAVLSVIIALFSRTLLHGLMKLNDRMRRVEEGELDLVVTAVSRDEIGQLTNRFGLMLRRINQLIEEAYVNRIARKEAELIALQAQINPHFLYNSLSLINSQAIGKEAYDISRTVTLLAKFYRTALNKGKEYISVRDELSMVRSYVELQQIMSGHAFDVVYELEDRIYPLGIVRLVLQPLVENAIDHGLKEKTEGLRMLTVGGRIQDGDLVLSISDTGVGMDEETVSGLLTSRSSGYGLTNVHERLRLYFGEPYGLEISSRVGLGTTVEVRLPGGQRSPHPAIFR